MEESDRLIANELAASANSSKFDFNIIKNILTIIVILIISVAVYYGYDHFFGTSHFNELKKQQMIGLKTDLENYVKKQRGMPSNRIKYWKQEFLESGYNRSAVKNPTNDQKYKFRVAFRDNFKNKTICKETDDCQNTIYVDPGFACSKDGVEPDSGNVAFRTILSNETVYCVNYK